MNQTLILTRCKQKQSKMRSWKSFCKTDWLGNLYPIFNFFKSFTHQLLLGSICLILWWIFIINWCLALILLILLVVQGSQNSLLKLHSCIQALVDVLKIRVVSFENMPYLDWCCVILNNCTWASLILSTIRDSVNGNGITIFCYHFILLTGVPFVSNELILGEKVQMHLFAQVHFIYFKTVTMKKC